MGRAHFHIRTKDLTQSTIRESSDSPPILTRGVKFGGGSGRADAAQVRPTGHREDKQGTDGQREGPPKPEPARAGGGTHHRPRISTTTKQEGLQRRHMQRGPLEHRTSPRSGGAAVVLDHLTNEWSRVRESDSAREATRRRKLQPTTSTFVTDTTKESVSVTKRASSSSSRKAEARNKGDGRAVHHQAIRKG